MQPHEAAFIEQEKTMTYGELADRVLRTASHLAKLGVARGGQVGLCLKDDSQQVVALLAIAHMGATAVQIDTRSRATERARIVDAFPLRLALVTPEGAKGIDCPKVVVDTAWHAAVSAADRNVAAAQDWHAPIGTQASSGTTGLPKFTLVTHLQYHFHMACYLEVIPPGRHRYLSTLPLYFTAGRLACLSHLLRGDTVVLYPALFSPEELIEVISRHKITVAFIVPSALRQILTIAEDRSPHLPSIDLLITGGSPLFAEERLQVIRKVTPRFCEMYGTAATGPIAALQPEDIRERPTSVGRPFSYVNVEIVDDDGTPLDHGATGQLRYRGPGLTLPMTDAEDFRDGWYYPGELAAIDERGYIFLRGRASEVIFRGGAKIFPSEVEAVLQEHKSVAEAAVVGRSLSNNEQEPVAYVVARDAVTPGELLAHCRTKLTAFKVPRQIHVVVDFPRNSSGKIDKLALANLHHPE
jgi:long-chain acyl-CoA synthetase